MIGPRTRAREALARARERRLIRNMKVARLSLGLSQLDLAAMLTPPVTQPRISAWENGIAKIPAARREQLGRILAVHSDDLDKPVDLGR